LVDVSLTPINEFEGIRAESALSLQQSRQVGRPSHALCRAAQNELCCAAHSMSGVAIVLDGDCVT
jgi:hypothetical protein